jgi:hypothetical protein
MVQLPVAIESSKTMNVTIDLTKKSTHPDLLAEKALEDDELLQALLRGVSPDVKKQALRENCSQALLYMAEQWPEMLLPHWEYFVGLLKSDNGFSKYVAIHVVALLVPLDKKGSFEKAFNVFYGLLDDDSVMVASHAAGVSGSIAKAKPNLQSKITKRMLGIGESHFEASRQDLIKSYIIDAFDQYFEGSKDKAKIIEFVRQQVNSSSPKTRKLSKEFLKKWDV